MGCPICRQAVKAEEPEYPFCSRRCRTQDLANWAEGIYRVPAPEGDNNNRSENSSRRNP
ncbi:MAG: DNA gyrase inhibitor YacG [Terriglobales bacterium]